MTKQLVWDIETNGLLDTMDEVWILCAEDIDTGTTYDFSDHDKTLPNMDYGIELLDQCQHHIGHNLFGFDFLAMNKKYGWELRDDQKVTDTWILSLLNCYKRDHNHGLKGWGEKLGNSKIEFNDWEKYSPEMKRYCRQDVRLNTEVYRKLHSEAKSLIARNPLYSKRIMIEMYVSRLNMKQQRGWVYDRELADKTIEELDTKMKKVERAIEPKLGHKRVWIDKAPKTPKYTSKGWYHSITAKLLSEYLGTKVIPEDALKDNPPIKPGEHFQRFKEEKVTMGQMDDVKTYLMEQCGWKPNEWNRTKTPTGGWKNSSPKLEGKNLEELGDVGKGVSEYYMLRHRRSFIEGFNKLSDIRGDGRINGGMWTIGTPTFRVRHTGIVNLPKNDENVPYGKEIRSLLTVEDDRVVVGADSAGNQLRGACHVFNNPTFTDRIVNSEDAHQENADAVGCTRDEAKVFIYRVLFATTAFGLAKAFGKTEAYAQDILDTFDRDVPEFKVIKDKYESEWHQNGGYIFGLTGNILFVEEPRKCLNSVLQDLEKASCAAALWWAEEEMKKVNIDYYPLIFYHDEGAFAVKKDQAEEAAKIISNGFKEGPKIFGIEIMDGGGGQIGRTYADVH
jgi:hypothetical protein